MLEKILGKIFKYILESQKIFVLFVLKSLSPSWKQPKSCHSSSDYNEDGDCLKNNLLNPGFFGLVYYGLFKRSNF
jgi:hypothetical protein